MLVEIALRAAGRDDAEAQFDEPLDRGQDARLVVVLDRDEDGAGNGNAHAGAKLALGEGHVVASGRAP